MKRPILLLLLAFALLLTTACEEGPCKVQWRQQCECCDTQKERDACHRFIEETYLSKITDPDEAELKDCKEKVRDFKCSSIPGATKVSLCNP